MDEKPLNDRRPTMITPDAAPMPTYAVYQTVHAGRAAFDSSDPVPAPAAQPALLVRVVHLREAVNLSADPAPTAAAVDTDPDIDTDTSPAPARTGTSNWNWKSTAPWQWLSELIAVGAFLVATFTLLAPGWRHDGDGHP
jgi:hypothetical protein